MTKGSVPRRKAAASVKGRECPICGKPAQPEAFPFCSKRCKAVDLNRWLSGRYVIPGPEDAPAEADEQET